MKNIISIFCLILCTSLNAKIIDVKPRVIYGIDDRSDIFESSDGLMKEMSKSVLVQMLDIDLEEKDGKYKPFHKTQIDQDLCPEEKYANQIVAGHCSGFLISKDVVVTAGHCVRDVNDCQNQFWIFDFANYDFEKSDFEFTNNQVFKCQNVISREKDSVTGIDYAVIKLDRVPQNRTPLKIRTSGRLDPDAILTVIGAPNGIPLKITTGAVVRDNSKEEYFVMNSDTYGGNSGSPVINTKSGIVEGILVRGDLDFEMAPGRSCYKSVNRPNEYGRGEDATRITKIKLK